MADYLRIPRHNISVSLLRSLVSLAVLALGLLIASPATHAQDSPTSDPVLSAALDHTGSAIQQATLAQTQAGQVQDRITADIAAHPGQANTASLSQQEQTELQLRMTEMQQQWTVVSTALQSLSQEYMTVAQNAGADASADTAGATSSNFDFNQMLFDLQGYTSQVDQMMQQIQTETSGNVSLGTMFQMQFHMEVMSQYIESVSNTLSAINNEMITMARATKGQ